MSEEIYEQQDVFTLTDEEGNESEFELLATIEDNGTTYLALSPMDEEAAEEGSYVILKLEEGDDGDNTLVTVDDDAEFDRIADLFDAQFAELD